MGAAGILYVADGRVLLLQRALTSAHGGTWGFPAGGIEDGETALEAAIRESNEETGYQPVFTDELPLIQDNGDFSLFLCDAERFHVQLNPEHDGYVWATPEQLPQPLHPGTKEAIDTAMARRAEMAHDSKDVFAFDESARRYDQDGRLHVDVSNISKANVCDYFGSEIPDWEALGLDPKRLYKLYRHPAELKKAAKTFNNLPILDTHIPAVSWNHPQGRVVGTTGTDAVFQAPYLKNSLAFWTDDSIKGIESRRQRELSSAYRYTADMTPGVSPDGESYDGIMRNILGNHVAVVPDGRAGKDVVVGDSKSTTLPLEIIPMPTTAPSNLPALLQGALMVSIKLAADEKPDYTAILAEVNEENFSEKKADIVTALQPFLAADADIDGLRAVLDTFGGEEAPMPTAIDASPAEDIIALLRGKVDEATLSTVAEKINAACATVQHTPAMDDDVDVSAIVGDDPPPFAGKPEVGEGPKQLPEHAMDEATVKKIVDEAVATARLDTTNQMNALREAEGVVRPYVGTIAADSAEGIYKGALDTLGINVEGVHPSAYRAILEAQPKPTDKQPMAVDAMPQVSELQEQFPDLAAMRTV